MATRFAVWAPNAERRRRRRLHDWGGGARSSRWPRPASGRGSCPASGRGARYKYRIARATAATRWTRPTRSPSPRAAARHRVGRVRTSTTPGATATGWRPAGRATPWTRPCRSTRCTSARGCATRASEPLARLPRAGAQAGRARQRRGFTHVELMPVTEHPFYGVLGLPGDRRSSPPPPATARPQDFMFLIDYLHQHGHRRDPRLDAGALSHRRARPDLLRRHAPVRTRRSAPGHPRRVGQRHLQLRPQRGAQLPDLQRELLAGRAITSTVCAWTRWRRCCTWTTAASRASGSPTSTAGARTWRRSTFMRTFNESVYRQHPDVQTIAEESTSWPMVSRPTYLGGLGFGLKWDMGWMHDTLDVPVRGPDLPPLPPPQADLPQHVRLHRELRAAAVARRGGARQGVAAGQDARRRLAEVREPAAAATRICGRSRARSCCSWAASSGSGASGTTTAAWTGTCWASRRCTRQLLDVGGRAEPAVPGRAGAAPAGRRPGGFEWIAADDDENSVFGSCARGDAGGRRWSAVFNFTPVPRHDYRIGVPEGGRWARS